MFLSYIVCEMRMSYKVFFVIMLLLCIWATVIFPLKKISNQAINVKYELLSNFLCWFVSLNYRISIGMKCIITLVKLILKILMSKSSANYMCQIFRYLERINISCISFRNPGPGLGQAQHMTGLNRLYVLRCGRSSRSAYVLLYRHTPIVISFNLILYFKCLQNKGHTSLAKELCDSYK